MISANEQLKLYERYKNTYFFQEIIESYKELSLDVLTKSDGENIRKDFVEKLKMPGDKVLKKFVVWLSLIKINDLMFNNNSKINDVIEEWKPFFNFEYVTENKGEFKKISPVSDSYGYKLILFFIDQFGADIQNLGVVPYPLKSNEKSPLYSYAQDVKMIVNSLCISKYLEPGNKDLIKTIENRAFGFIDNHFVSNPENFVNTFTSNNFSATSLIRLLLSYKNFQGNIIYLSTIEGEIENFLDNERSSNKLSIKNIKEILIGLKENKINTESQLFEMLFDTYTKDNVCEKDELYVLNINKRIKAYDTLMSVDDIFSPDLLKKYKIGKFEFENFELLTKINSSLEDLNLIIEKKSKKSIVTLHLKQINSSILPVYPEVNDWLIKKLKWGEVNGATLDDEISVMIESCRMKKDIKFVAEKMNQMKKF